MFPQSIPDRFLQSRRRRVYGDTDRTRHEIHIMFQASMRFHRRTQRDRSVWIDGQLPQQVIVGGGQPITHRFVVTFRRLMLSRC